jgi:signal transduction histidine kinase
MPAAYSTGPRRRERKNEAPNDPKKKPRVDADLGRIYGAARHLLALINDVLDLSKIEAGKMELDLTEIDPSGCSRRSPTPCAASSSGAATSWSAPGPRLLSNAAKFTEDGRVTLAAVAHGQGLTVEIADTGIGIAQSDQERLFRPFVNAPGQGSVFTVRLPLAGPDRP